MSQMAQSLIPFRGQRQCELPAVRHVKAALSTFQWLQTEPRL